MRHLVQLALNIVMVNRKATPQRNEYAEREVEAIEYLASANLHQTFTLPPSTCLNRNRPVRITYSDTGRRFNEDGTPSRAVILACMGMFGDRWMGVMHDKAASTLGVRLINVDRPGMGGSSMVEIKDRVQTWLEIVIALLDHLKVKHVALLSHSAGTIYLLNSLLHQREILHPKRPYVAILAPWIHPVDSRSTRFSLTRFAPDLAIGHYHCLVKFMVNNINPALAFSGGICSKLGSAFPAFKPDGRSSSKLANAKDKAKQSASSPKKISQPKVMSRLISQYALAEDISGGSQEGLLCLKRPQNYWGEWKNYDKFTPMLAASEKKFRHDSGLNGCEQAKLRVEVFYAEHDSMINGRTGSEWFDKCWSEDARAGVIDYHSQTVPGKNHESIILGKVSKGPIHDVFTEVAALFAE